MSRGRPTLTDKSRAISVLLSVICCGLLHSFHHVVRCQHRVCEKREVNERRRVTVAPLGMPWGSRRVLRNSDLETLLQQIAQVRFDADVRQHPTKNDIADAA